MRITPLPRHTWSLYLLILSVFFIVSCKKEQSFEAGNDVGLSGTAVFTLVPSGNDCSDATTTGTYTAGQATTVTELVLLTVNVTAPGTWAYKTPTVNGFSFSGSGEFGATGDQLIALVASGTPAVAGITSFPLKIGSVDCSFDISVGTTSNEPPGELYYKATIGGVNYTESVTATNDYIAGSGLSGQDVVSFSASIEPLSSPRPAGSTAMIVDKGMLSGYMQASDATVKNFFGVNSYSYAPPGISPYQNGNGVIITWIDKAGELWTSFHATQAQPAGSSFKIISVEDAPDLTGTYYVKVKMQFSCTLYKANGGGTVTLTDGEMVAYFGKI